jgi:hypothetical protein
MTDAMDHVEHYQRRSVVMPYLFLPKFNNKF